MAKYDDCRISKMALAMLVALHFLHTCAHLLICVRESLKKQLINRCSTLQVGDKEDKRELG